MNMCGKTVSAGCILFMLGAAGLQAANQYWDTNPDAGIQGGNGTWSTGASDTNWSDSATGTVLATWTLGNNASFVTPSNGASSAITVNNSVTAGTVTISGRPYTLNVSNGASFFSGAITVGNAAGASNNSYNVGGGAAVTVSNGTIDIGLGGGCYNTMTVTNANIWSAGLNIGNNANSALGTTNNSVNVLANTMWNMNGGNVVIGSAGLGYTFGNSLTVDGGVLTNVGGTLYIGGGGGGGSAGSYSSLLITNGGAVYLNTGPFYLGLQGGTNNSFTVTGTGSVFRNTSGTSAGFSINWAGLGDNLVVANGGKIIYKLTTLNVGAFGGTNTALVTGPGSVWSNNFSGGGGGAGYGIGIGKDYSFNSVIISNGGAFYGIGETQANDGHEVLGWGVTAVSNSIIVTGPGSIWVNDSDWGNSRFIGRFGSSYNSMKIADGGCVRDVLYLSGAYIGGDTGAGTNNMVIVTDPGSSWQVVTGSISVGNAGPNNQLIVSNGANVVCYGTGAGALTIGVAAGANSNSVLVTGAGSVMSNSGALTVGNAASCSFNSVTVTNGASLFSSTAVIGSSAANNMAFVAGGASTWNVKGQNLTIGTGSSAATNNILVIDGAGAVGGAIVTNVGTLFVGDLASAGDTRSILIITNGGVLVVNSAPTIGDQCGGNMVVVSGTGSLLTAVSTVTLNLGAIAVGGRSGNTLRVENGGVVSNMNLVEGVHSQCDANRVIVSAGGKFYGKMTVGYVNNNNSVSITGGDGVNSLWDCQNNPIAITGGPQAFSNQSLLIDGAGYEGSAVVTNATTVDLISSGHGGIWCSLVVTNKGRLHATGLLKIGDYFTAGPIISHDNRLVVAQGGKVFAVGMTLGLGNSNLVNVSGSGSLLDLGGGNVAIGNAARVGNQLTIDQGGMVNNIGTLTVTNSNNVNLYGGTLGVANMIYTNAQFVVGDGIQVATLQSLAGGTLTFSNGLALNTNAILRFAGTVNGCGQGIIVGTNAALLGSGTVKDGVLGIIITNGATFSAGTNGAGTLTIGGSNLTWNSGGIYRCEITNISYGTGLGWDLLNISSQLNLANGPGFVIKLDSVSGSPAANFNPNSDYGLRILSYGWQNGFAASSFTIDTNSFPGSTGNWSISNQNNSLYLQYRGSGLADTSTPGLVWMLPSNGLWSAGENWSGAAAPAAGGDGTYALEFGGDGTAYYSTNDLATVAGQFVLNRLLLTSKSGAAVTNIITGGKLVFTNANARIDCQESGSYLIGATNLFMTNVVLGGIGGGGTVVLQTNLIAMGSVVKQGPWTLELLGSSNNFMGPLLVDSPDGTLRACKGATFGYAGSLDGSGSITVLSGTLATPDGFVLGNMLNNRVGLLTGSGSVWTNGGNYFRVGFRGCGNVFTVASNAQLAMAAGNINVGAGSGSFSVQSNSLVVTNGGRVVITGTSSTAIGASASNNTLAVAGTNSQFIMNGTYDLYVGDAGDKNTLLVTGGGVFTNASATAISVTHATDGNAANNSVIVANGGRIYTRNATTVGYVGVPLFIHSNAVVVTGPGSLFNNGDNIYVARSYFNGGTSRWNSLTIQDQAIVTNSAAGNSSFAAFSLNNTNRALLAFNSLNVTNGGKYYLGGGKIYGGFGTNVFSNAVTVAGADTVLDAGGGTCYVGLTGACWNSFSIMNGGLATNIGVLVIAKGAGAASNSVTVDGGTLHAGFIASSNSWPNYIIIGNGGIVTVTNLLVITNANFGVTFSGGILNLKNAQVSNGVEWVAGDGVQTATVNLKGGITVFNDGLVITNNATLAGNGWNQATTTVYGTLSPGSVIGAITNVGNLTLKVGGRSVFEIATNSPSAPGISWDFIFATNGTLTLGGTLRAQLSGGFIPTNTDSYLIMTNTQPLSGSFENVSDGQTLSVYTNGLDNSVIGTFRVNVGSQSVILDNFQRLSVAKGSVWSYY